MTVVVYDAGPVQDYPMRQGLSPCVSLCQKADELNQKLRCLVSLNQSWRVKHASLLMLMY